MTLVRRPAESSDLDALEALFVAYDTWEFGRVEMERDDIRAMLELPGSQQLVLERDGRVIGYADLAPNGEGESAAHPDDAEVADLHRELLGWLADGARALGKERLEHWSGPRPDGASQRLTSQGFEHVRTAWQMRRGLDGELPEPVWPGTASVAPFEEARDAEQVWDLITRGFAGQFGSHPRPFEEWRHLALRPGSSVIRVVEEGRLLGVSVNVPRASEGYVLQLAVEPSARGRGLGLALLHETFRRDQAAGLPATALGVDGQNDNARKLYEKAGMSVVEEFRRWDLVL